MDALEYRIYPAVTAVVAYGLTSMFGSLDAALVLGRLHVFQAKPILTVGKRPLPEEHE
jgi:hypothetical protein